MPPRLHRDGAYPSHCGDTGTGVGINARAHGPERFLVITAYVLPTLPDGRLGELEGNFHAAGASLGGIQESCAQGNLHIVGDRFGMYTSGATSSGCLGMQLWIAMGTGNVKVEVVPDSNLVHMTEFRDSTQSCIDELRGRAASATVVFVGGGNLHVGGDRYGMCTSGATSSGCLGMQLWIAMDIGYVKAEVDPDSNLEHMAESWDLPSSELMCCAAELLAQLWLS